MGMKEFCGTEFWDPALTWYTSDPDFTLCFKLTALVWTPCAFLWLLSPLDIFYMKVSSFRGIPWSYQNVTKFIIIMLLLIISLIDFIMSLVMNDDENVYNAHRVTPIIKVVTFLYAGILTFYHKKYGIQSSGTLFLFWLILCIFAIPQYRSEIRNYSDSESPGDWQQYQFISYMIYFPLTVIILIVCCFSDKHPTEQLHKKVDKPNPELSASFIRNMLFQQFDRDVWTGYRRPLEFSDMHDLNPDSVSETIYPVFDKYWKENVAKNQKKQNKKTADAKVDSNRSQARVTNGSVLIPLFQAFGPTFLFSGVLKFIIDMLSFAQPQLLSALIMFTYPMLDGTTLIYEDSWKGFVYAFALFFVSFLTSILNGQHFLRSFVVGFRIRSVLVNAIYRKALRISSSAKKTTTVGEIVNLMAVDAQRFFELMGFLHIIWAGPLVMGLAIYFLYDIIGVAVFVGLGFLIVLLPLNAYIATKLRSFQIKQMKQKDERVKLMNEVLGGIKVLKLYAWEESFEASVQDVRDKEMLIIKYMAYFGAGTHFLWTMTPFIVTLASFATYVLIDENNVMTANTAFVSLSLFNILRMPMAMFPMMIAMTMQAWVSITRINNFLNKEELDPDCVTHEKNDYSLLIENGTFSWGEQNQLNNINIKVKPGELVAIVGPVGCGKSSLISALLGEMEKIDGNVNTYGKIAYVAQQAWIQNATLKDNILFGKEFDQEKYDKIVEACALTADLKMLPGGDQTEIGEKGINLSGGQKQRVSLARAVYNDADIYLLDDPLSAVDAHVGKHIFENVIGPTGLLSGKTVFLVTHAITYLPKVDNIFVVSNGEITESGTYNKLIEQKGAFADFIIQHLQEIDEEELEEIKQALSEPSILQRAISIRTSGSDKKTAPNGVSYQRSKSVLSETEKEPKTEAPQDMSKLIHSEDSATGSVEIGVYIRYIKSIGIPMVITTLITAILNQAFSVYSNTWLTEWAEDPNNVKPEVRDMYLGVYGGLGIGQAIFLFTSSIVLSLGCVHAAKILHSKLLKHSLRLPMSFFDTTPLGRIMNRFSKDIDMVDNILPMSIRALILMFFSVVAIFVVISISTPIFIAVIVPIAILYYLIQKFYIATSRQLKRLESTTRSPIYSHFGESITGQSSIRAYEAQTRFTTDSTNKLDFNQKCIYPTIVAMRWLSVRLETIGSLVILFAALFAVLARGNISGSIVGLSVSYALQITMVLSFMVRLTAEVETNIVAIERIEEYAELPTEAPLLTKQMDQNWPQNGEVIFDNLKVRYREGLELVLKGISFQVHGGEKVGIVGRTGAGKSSLTVALFRLIEADSGKIVIDNENIADMGLHSLRSRLTIIPQDPVLFSGTVRMNVDPFETYTDDDIWLALHHAHLKHYVKGLPDGLQHLVSEGGENLSVGQRQLICLARALLRKTKILILDEATAAIDLETDDLIQKTIRSQFSDCTILTIAHRLNTILDSDRVLVLDKGYIAEYDSPANLLDNRDSIFYGMAKSAGIVS